MKKLNANNLIYYTVLFAIFLWMMIGVFPLYCYENDSMRIIAGCEIMYNQGWQLPPVWSYEYRMQPLITITVVAFKYIFTILTCQQIYCLLSAFCSIVFLFGCQRFVKHLLPKANNYSILLAVLLLPETYAIAMYPNSAIFAAALFIWALDLLFQKKIVFSFLLLCIAPLFRVDIVVVYPCILPFFIYKGISLKSSILRSAFFAIGVVAVLALCFWLLKANPLDSVIKYRDWNARISRRQHIIALLAFYSLPYFILLPLGLIKLAKMRYFKLLALCIVPIFLEHYIFRKMGCAAKHYLYIAPFILLLGTVAIETIKSWADRAHTIKIVAALGLTIYFFGSFVRVNHDDITSYNKLGPSYPLLCLGGEYSYNIGLGAGQLMATQDEFIIETGQFFYPFYIRRLKEHKEKEVLMAYNFLKNKGNLSLLTLNGEDVVSLPIYFLADGYKYTKVNIPGENYILQKSGKRILVRNIMTNSMETIDEVIKTNPFGNSYYIATSIDEDASWLQRLSKTNEKLTMISNNLFLYKD